jgi:hypothetical protein
MWPPGSALSRALIDATTDVLADRKQLNEFAQVIKVGQNNGGNAIRVQFDQAIAAEAA